MANNEGKSKHSCIRCGKQIKHYDLHIKTCKKAVEDVDFVKCKICNKKFRTLYVHCLNHNLNSEKYEKQYGKLMCSEAELLISERNSKTQQKHNYRNKLKFEGKLEELKIFNDQVGKKVSEVILASDELREIRSQTLSNLNKTDQFRKKASETAIETSKRKDILENRTNQLRDWREKNPEKMSEILSNLHSRYQSRPEKELFELIQNLFPNLLFKRNQQINRKSIFKLNKSGIKQIDILSINNKIIVEYDGDFHFENVKKWNQLELIRQKDLELNSLSNEFCIIRVSHDQYSYRKIDGGFKQECIDKLTEIIKDNKPGLYLIGDLYAQN